MSEHTELALTGVVAGLSIDDGLLRVVVLDRRAEPTVVDDAEADLDPAVVQDGRVVDNAGLGRRIGELWRALGLGGVPTFLGFQPADGRLRSVAVGNWPRSGWPAEVLAAVATLRSRYGGEPVWNAAPLWQGDLAAARIAACRRDDISNAVWAARRSGVWVAGVELMGLALERALRPMQGSYALVVDRSRAGLATMLLFDHGAAVLGWRAPLVEGAAPAGALTVFPLDEATAVSLAQAATPPTAWLAAAPPSAGHQAELLGPDAGLASASPGVPAAFGVELGLALGAAGLGIRPVELQASLLNTGVAMLQSRLASGAVGGLTPVSVPETATMDDTDWKAAVGEAVVTVEEHGEDVAAVAGAEGAVSASPTEVTPLPRRRRRTKTVAVVAGAAAVGSFLVARTVGNDPQTGPREEDGMESPGVGSVTLSNGTNLMPGSAPTATTQARVAPENAASRGSAGSADEAAGQSDRAPGSSQGGAGGSAAPSHGAGADPAPNGGVVANGLAGPSGAASAQNAAHAAASAPTVASPQSAPGLAGGTVSSAVPADASSGASGSSGSSGEASGDRGRGDGGEAPASSAGPVDAKSTGAAEATTAGAGASEGGGAGHAEGKPATWDQADPTAGHGGSTPGTASTPPSDAGSKATDGAGGEKPSNEKPGTDKSGTDKSSPEKSGVEKSGVEKSGVDKGHGEPPESGAPGPIVVVAAPTPAPPEIDPAAGGGSTSTPAGSPDAPAPAPEPAAAPAPVVVPPAAPAAEGAADPDGRWFDIPLRPSGAAHVAVVRNGFLYFNGAVRSTEQAASLRRRAAELYGEDHIAGRLQIDASAGVDAGEGVRFGDCVEFDAESAEIAERHHEVLDQVSATMAEHPHTTVTLDGHSDGQGDLGDNVALSKARAEAVGAVLEERGVERERITTKARGPFVPVADESGDEGRARNRRVSATFQGLLR